jgi:FemAB-related protein (PEP-CTERM system-associated)
MAGVALEFSATATATSPVSVSLATDGDAVIWNQFVEAHPEGSVDHLWEWRQVFNDVFRQQCRYLLVRRGNAITGVLPLVFIRSWLFGRLAVSLPYANYAGLLATDDESARALVDEARQHAHAFGATHVELRNINRTPTDLPIRTHKVGARLTLPATVDELWNGLDRKVRNQVRKAQKEGLVVESGGPELLDAFYEVFARNMRDLGTPVFPRQLFASVLKLFPANARVFVVRHGAVPAAASVALAWRDSMLVPWASSLREFRNQCPNMLLYWHMLEHAIGERRALFDFGRSTRDGGTHQFKQQWGATTFPLHWEYVMVRGGEPPDHGTSNPRLEFFIRSWRRLPVKVASTIGPAVIRHIA